MIKGKTQEIIVGAMFGIIGVIIGSVATGLMNAHVQRQRQHVQAVLNSFKFDQGNYPVEYEQLKQMLNEVKTLSTISSRTIARLAAIQRKYPGCAHSITDRCRPVFVETIQAMRDELGSGLVSNKDIDTLLSPFYETAVQAVQRLRKSE